MPYLHYVALPCHHMSPKSNIKRQRSQGAAAEEELREIQSPRRTRPPLTPVACFEMEEGSEGQQVSSRLRVTPSLLPAWKWGPQSCSHKELSSATTRTSSGTDAFLAPLGRNGALQIHGFRPVEPGTENEQSQTVNHFLIERLWASNWVWF